MAINIPYDVESDTRPNLWGLTRDMGLIPPSCLVVVRRFTGAVGHLFLVGGPVERLTTPNTDIMPLPLLPSKMGNVVHRRCP